MWNLIKRFGERLIEGFKDMLKDLFFWAFEVACDLVIYIFESLSAPVELLNLSISTFISPDVAYFLALSGLDQCMVLIGAAVLFRMVRKFLTFGLW